VKESLPLPSHWERARDRWPWNPLARASGPFGVLRELSAESEAFRTRWAHDSVRFNVTRVKRLHHCVVCDLISSFETMERAADAGPTMVVYTRQPAPHPAKR
jgi:MmyB-like transcription regulator ligand binding domain